MAGDARSADLGRDVSDEGFWGEDFPDWGEFGQEVSPGGGAAASRTPICPLEGCEGSEGGEGGVEAWELCRLPPGVSPELPTSAPPRSEEAHT